MDQASKELLYEKNWAIMDVEYISTSKTHRCIRKLYILEENGYTDMELDFYPCKRYIELEREGIKNRSASVELIYINWTTILKIIHQNVSRFYRY